MTRKREYREVPYSNNNWNRDKSIYRFHTPSKPPVHIDLYTESISIWIWNSGTVWYHYQYQYHSIEIPYHYGKVWICMYLCGPRIQSSKSILSSSPTLFVEFVVSVYPLDGNSQDWHLHGSRTATGTMCYMY